MFRSITTVSTMAVGAFAMDATTQPAGEAGHGAISKIVQMQANVRGNQARNMFKEMQKKVVEVGEAMPLLLSGQFKEFKARFKLCLEGLGEDETASDKTAAKHVHDKMDKLVEDLPNDDAATPAEAQQHVQKFVTAMLDILPKDMKSAVEKMMKKMEDPEFLQAMAKAQEKGPEEGQKIMIESLMNMKMTPEQMQQMQQQMQQMEAAAAAAA